MMLNPQDFTSNISSATVPPPPNLAWGSGADADKINVGGTLGPHLTGPQGIQGIAGTDGIDGIDGTNGLAATLALGTIATGAPGSNVIINNSGTNYAAVLDITIPRGETGASGEYATWTGDKAITGDLSVGSEKTGPQIEPSYIDLGNSYYDGSAREKLKIFLYGKSVSNAFGFGVGAINDIQYHTGAYHDFFINNNRVFRIGPNELSALGNCLAYASQYHCQDNESGSIELATYRGSLTGYPSNYYPTIKSNSSIYFSTNGKYSLAVQSSGSTTHIQPGANTVIAFNADIQQNMNGTYNNVARLGSCPFSWGGGGGIYPTLWNPNTPDGYVMHVNPHIAYTQNGVNGFTGTANGAGIRMASDTAASHYWDAGVGRNSSGPDIYSIGRDNTYFFYVHPTGYCWFTTDVYIASRKMATGSAGLSVNRWLYVYVEGVGQLYVPMYSGTVSGIENRTIGFF